MKRIGIIGGLGPEATIEYYRIITGEYRRRAPGGDYPTIILHSVNLTELLAMAEAGEWSGIADLLVDAVAVLVRAGADFALISANTPHIVFDDVRARAGIPMISIVEETARAAEERGLERLLLLGTRFTMQGVFYQNVFDRSGIELVVPETVDQLYMHDKLVNEIGVGRIIDDTRREFLAIIERARGRSGIDGVILGCTELPLILTGDALGLPFLDTTRIHAESAVRRSLEE
jgi:aspartate racemase